MSGTSLSGALAAYSTIGSWLTLDEAGCVTAYSGKVEFGQGIRTALAQLVAHELDVPIDAVIVAPVDTQRSPDEGVTSGSRSIEEANEGLRVAAATLRETLRRRGAERLAIALDTAVAGNGAVTSSDGTSVTYAELWDESVGTEPIDPAIPLREPNDRSPLGTSTPRTDLAAKITGQPIFIQDIELPGMLHGRVLRPPATNASLVDVNDAQVRDMPGVEAVVRDGSFVGVVAEREEQAIRALARLRRIASWSAGKPLPHSPRFLLEAPTRDVVVHERGTVLTDDLTDGCVRITAEYSRPYLAHASLGPSCAVATFDGTGVEVWSHSQGIYHLRQELAKVLRLRPDQVLVHHVEGAGCYGANGADDVALDAALLARALPGRPVRVQWMRDDEFAWEPLGSATVVRLDAVLDPNGCIVSWKHDVWGNGHRDRPDSDSAQSQTNLLAARHLATPFEPSVAPPPPSRSSGSGRNAAPLYAFPNQRIVNHYVAETPLRVSALRSLGAHANVFGSESFMDEIATLVGTDPLAHRLQYLEDARAREVVIRAAELAGWDRRAEFEEGHGLGLGFARYKGLGCYAAVVAEIEIEDDLRLTRVVAAVDPGLVVNPDGVRNQAEGGILQAASWTLSEEVRFDSAGITSRDWRSYPILRFTDVPEMEIDVISHPDEPPSGVGEAFAGPTAAAIGNAIFHATGARLRDMPLTRDRLIRALA